MRNLHITGLQQALKDVCGYAIAAAFAIFYVLLVLILWQVDRDYVPPSTH